MKPAFAALRALTYMTGFVFFWAWLALGVRKYDEGIGFVLPAWAGVVGAILMLAGAVLALTCVGFFAVRGRGTPAPFDPPREFVAVGPYKYARNPMYIGAIILVIGFGLYIQSISIVLFSLVFLVIAHLFVFFVEEPGLENRFGQSYLDYKKSVNRWIPKWK